jgi:hypothetical protein
MSLTNYFTSRAILLALASLVAIASAYSLENDGQHPLHAHTNSNFSIGFSLQSFCGAAAVIFEGVDGTLETHTRIYEPGCYNVLEVNDLISQITRGKHSIRSAAASLGLVRTHQFSLNSGQSEGWVSPFNCFNSTFLYEIYQNNHDSYINKHYITYSHI